MQARYATASNIDDDINDNDGKDYNDKNVGDIDNAMTVRITQFIAQF